MKSGIVILLSCLLFVAISAVSNAASSDLETKVFREKCLGCHPPDNAPLDKMHLSREEWNSSIDRMAPFGVEVSKEERAAVLDYLVRIAGPDAAKGDKK